jgi:hypothetical protein
LDADGMMWACEVIVTTEDGTEVARSFIRTSYVPAETIPYDAPQMVRDVASVAWTPEVIAKYAEKSDSEETPEPE